MFVCVLCPRGRRDTKCGVRDTMPHVNGSDGDDLGDADEIKVFKHDEECEEEKKLIAEERQSDSLTEDKSSLITEGESQVIPVGKKKKFKKNLHKIFFLKKNIFF